MTFRSSRSTEPFDFDVMHRLPVAYHRFLLTRPRTVLTVLALLLAFFSYHSQDFKLDASADSLLLEDDKDLHLLREVNARYQTQDLLIVTFTPTQDLFSDDSLTHLKRLRDELRSIDGVESVVTILDVPLVTSSDVPLTQMADNVQTLQTPTIDRRRARVELSTSPVYKDLVISSDTHTTALLLNLKGDEDLASLQITRGQLLSKRRSGQLSREERRQLQDVSARSKEVRASLNDRRHEEIEKIRSLLDGYRDYGALHLGGVPMIADDMVSFVKNDLIVFGSGALVLLVVVLIAIFRELRWVILPLLSCFYAGMTMIGMLGLIGWEVTVISSNFLALLLIITISMSIHLIVRYRQLFRDAPDDTQVALVSSTLRKMVWPCLYAALTTIIGFSSLVFSDIKPVIDFGWMMSVGLSVTFLTSFSLFPAILLMTGKPKAGGRSGRELRLTARLANVTERHGNAILVTAVLLAVISGVGISRLTVENSFIDYFRKDTEIYQGMRLIDEKLGGTTPLEILLNWQTDRVFAEEEAEEESIEEWYDEVDEWNIDVGPEYWFTPFKIERIKEVHDYLDGLSEVGKVLSLASVIRVAEELNDGKEFNGLELSLFYKRLPDDIRESLIDPSRRPQDSIGPLRGRRNSDGDTGSVQQHAAEPICISDFEPGSGDGGNRHYAPHSVSIRVLSHHRDRPQRAGSGHRPWIDGSDGDSPGRHDHYSCRDHDRNSRRQCDPLHLSVSRRVRPDRRLHRDPADLSLQYRQGDPLHVDDHHLRVLDSGALELLSDHLLRSLDGPRHVHCALSCAHVVAKAHSHLETLRPKGVKGCAIVRQCL